MPNLFIKRGSGVIKVIIINNSNGSGVPPPGVPWAPRGGVPTAIGAQGLSMGLFCYCLERFFCLFSW